MDWNRVFFQWVAPLTRTFVVATANRKWSSVSRQQLPTGTPAYAFTDYHVQAQMIEYCVVDMSKLPKDGS